MSGSSSQQKNDTRRNNPIELCIQVLIVLSTVAFSVETVPNLPSLAITSLDWFERFCIVVFSIEYLVRLITSQNRLRFVFSFFGLVDLISILPYFLAATIDLRSVRIFRLLRLFRIFKLARYNAAVRRFHVALLLAKEEIILFIALTGIILFLAAVGIYYFEHEAQPEQFKSVFHSLWWAITTLTTVGYGDVVPVTTGGRIFTFVLLVVGLGVVSVPAGLVSAALLKARSLEVQEPSVQTADVDVRAITPEQNH
jgi:voltage-gated potassium channel